MKYIECTCADQWLEVSNTPEGLTRGTKGYLGVRVNFQGTSWNKCRVACEFKGDAAPLVGGTCAVPDAIAAKPYVVFRLVGQRDDGYRIITNWVVVGQGK